MNIKLGNLPNTPEAKEFEKMLLAAFNPMKDYIQYHNLENKLTPDDVHMFAHALAQGMMNWCEFLKMTKQRANDRHDY